MAKPVPPDMLKLAKETQALLTQVAVNAQTLLQSGVTLQWSLGPGPTGVYSLLSFEARVPVDLNEGSN